MAEDPAHLLTAFDLLEEEANELDQEQDKD